MKPHEHKTKPNREVPTPKPSESSKAKKQKNWILEYRWKSLKDYNTYPGYNFFTKEPFSDKYIPLHWWSKHITPSVAEEHIKKDLRSIYFKNRVMGKYWRVRHEITGEVIEFPNIENYYNS